MHFGPSIFDSFAIDSMNSDFDSIIRSLCQQNTNSGSMKIHHYIARDTPQCIICVVAADKKTSQPFSQFTIHNIIYFRRLSLY